MSESNFIQKVGAACNKKEDLYQKSKTRYERVMQSVLFLLEDFLL